MGTGPGRRAGRCRRSGLAAVTPTKSTYEFEGAGVHVTLAFLTPLLPHDLDVMGRPVTYLTWDVRSTDGAHARRAADGRDQRRSWRWTASGQPVDLGPRVRAGT